MRFLAAFLSIQEKHNILLKNWNTMVFAILLTYGLNSTFQIENRLLVLGAPIPITFLCGVPQGSILVPLLFIIYINDMHNAINFSKVHHFADDINFLFSHKNLKVLRKRVNSDLVLLFDWLCANRLSLNVGKTEQFMFRPARSKRLDRVNLKINRCKLFESNKIKYLGMILDSNLSWKHHI